MTERKPVHEAEWFGESRSLYEIEAGVVTTIALFEPLKRADEYSRLAAAAPEMARMLLSERDRVAAGDSSCIGCRKYWCTWEGPEANLDCPLLLLLRKGGVVE